MSKELPTIDPKLAAEKALAYLKTPAGKRALRRSAKRVEAAIKELEKCRPTKETWDWTVTI